MPTRLIFLLSVLAIAWTVPVLAADGAAKTGIAVKLAVIDIDAVRRHSLAIKGIRDQVAKIQKAMQADIAAVENALKAAQRDLVRQKTLLSAEAFEAERQKFADKVNDTRNRVERARADLEKAQAQAMGTVQGALNTVVAEIAREESLTLILRKDQTVLVARPLDISQEVVGRLDKALPKVAVSAPPGIK